MSREMSHRPQVIRAAAAGVFAGLAGAYAMELWQAGATKLLSTAAEKAGGSAAGGEASTEKAADAVSSVVRGRPVSHGGKAAAGRRIHYLAGAALGAAYGTAAEIWPAAAAGFGGGLALVSAVVLDDAVVPALRLGRPPQRTPPTTHAYGLFAHLVFGVTAEAARRLLRGAP